MCNNNMLLNTHENDFSSASKLLFKMLKNIINDNFCYLCKGFNFPNFYQHYNVCMFTIHKLSLLCG